MRQNKLSFDSNEIKEIKKIFPNCKQVFDGFFEGSIFIRYTQPQHHSITTPTFENDIELEKMSDEWYYVRFQDSVNPPSNRYYKCDQLNGLLECLDHIKSIFPI